MECQREASYRQTDSVKVTPASAMSRMWGSQAGRGRGDVKDFHTSKVAAISGTYVCSLPPGYAAIDEN